LYANLDAFKYQESEIPVTERPELDRWILSRLHSLVKQVKTDLDQFEPTRAARLIQDFVNDDLSNWYVRLCRRRFWKGEYGNDKIAAYQTLYTCLETVSILASPIAPFFCEKLFSDLNAVSKKLPVDSVHLAFFPDIDETKVDLRLERKMSMAQQISSMVLSIRKTRKIKVRQPLQRIMVPVLDSTMADEIKEVQEIILSEVNVKQLELLTDATHLLVKKIKPNFKTIGPRYGKQMKSIATMVQNWSATDILTVEQQAGWKGLIDNEEVILHRDDFEITAQDIPGWEVTVEGNMTVALDITITDQLKDEGIAREVVNRIQNLRKDSNFEVSDRILITIQSHPAINHAIETNLTYICAETLADNIQITDNELSAELVSIEEGV
jgi:isoleucyl-tRNA synthetase